MTNRAPAMTDAGMRASRIGAADTKSVARLWQSVIIAKTWGFANLCGRIDPAAMAALAALPSHFGGLS